MNEQELREILKLVRSLEHYIERCLRSEQEKNEERIKKQLENSGITVHNYSNESETEGFEF